MEIILKEDIPKLGSIGDVVKVKDGYARNYLIPKGLALEVTESSLKMIEAKRREKKLKEEEKKVKAEELAAKLSNISCTIAMPAGENDKLYGEVTHADIADALRQEGILIDKKDILLEEDVRRLGIYYFQVKLHPEVSQRLKLWVVKRQESS